MEYAVARFLKTGCVADPQQIRFSFAYVIFPNFFALGRTVWEYVGGLKDFWGRWVPLPWDGGVIDP